MADRYYRHELGYTTDQLRAAKQIRIARVAAASAYLAFAALLLLALSPVPLAGQTLATFVAAANAMGFSLFVVSASTAIVLGLSRKLLAPSHVFHAQCARWAWVLLPVGIGAATVGALTGVSGVVPALMVTLVVLVAAADSLLRRSESVGHHVSPRICVINLDTRTRTWHTEDELAAIDAAAQAALPVEGQSPDEGSVK